MTPSYYRARLGAFTQLIKDESGKRLTNDDLNLRILRNGVTPNGYDERLDHLIQMNLNKVSSSNLTFDEITRFNTWFEMHPKKVAGTEIIRTSREFPIQIKGTKEDIIQTLTPHQIPVKKDNRMRMAKAKAIARMRSLELVKI